MGKKAVLITGASRGIGKACALKLAEEGYAIGVNYNKNEQKANEIVNKIIDSGGEAKALSADVANEEDVKEMVGVFVEQFGGIFGLVNNAAA